MADESFSLAAALFPDETWVYLEDGIFMAQSRMSEITKEKSKWAKEYAQVKLLVQRGGIAYFLPEQRMGHSERRCADVVLDGMVMEMKTVTGTREILGTEFKLGYKQGAELVKNHPVISAHSVFIWLKSDLPVISVKAKIAGELKNRLDKGSFICFFDNSQELHSWTYEELRAFIRPKK
ncbi:MAG: hypothetical protein LBM77_12905 [Spirochaetaceae bacterium]|jgi:hypothetical protein|nr:hypothetical protein [Spirochaetaceae bacterium]